jgi:hypothetical protein
MLAFRWLSVMPPETVHLRHPRALHRYQLVYLVVGYQRNRLEQDRRQMAVKGEEPASSLRAREHLSRLPHPAHDH